MSIGKPVRSRIPALGRNVVSGRRHTFTGYVPSTKVGNDHQLIAYESLLERDFIQLLEDDDEVESYRDRSEAVIWTDESGAEHRSLPDFDVLKRNGVRICVEVKPFERIERKRLRPLYAMVEKAAIASGRFHRFEIWTDREIRRPIPLYNAELRNIGRLDEFDHSASISVIGALRAASGSCTIRELRLRSGLDAGSFRAVVASLAERRIIMADNALAIDDDCVVALEAVA